MMKTNFIYHNKNNKIFKKNNSFSISGKTMMRKKKKIFNKFKKILQIILILIISLCNKFEIYNKMQKIITQKICNHRIILILFNKKIRKKILII